MTTQPPAVRLPWTVRVATWSARHRWPVLLLLPLGWAIRAWLRRREPPAARLAFPGLRFTRKGATQPNHWVVQFQDATGYDKAREALQRQQLTRAAAHLAALLRNVFP